jgi:uncharacterized RmlC-like cupin family protein
MADWRDGVKVVRGAALDAAVLAGGGRATAVDFAGAGDGHTWIGKASMKPGVATGTHHHGNTEIAVYVLLGHAEIRWGERLEFGAEVGPGDLVYFAAGVIHQERNVSTTDTWDYLAIRSDAQRTVVKVDTPPVERPQLLA